LALPPLPLAALPPVPVALALPPLPPPPPLGESSELLEHATRTIPTVKSLETIDMCAAPFPRNVNQRADRPIQPPLSTDRWTWLFDL